MATGPAPAIEPVHADDRAAMDGWFALRVHCHAHDIPELPPPCRVSHNRAFSWPGSLRKVWIIRDGVDVVAVADLSLSLRDNLHHGFAGVLVAPAHRRRGLGTRLLHHVVAQARDAGRTRLALGTGARPGEHDPGNDFLRAGGARLGIIEKRRRLVLPPATPEALRTLAVTADAASPGYRLVQWTGPTPARWRDDLAPLVARMSTDAPLGEFDLGPQRWDAARIAERDAAALAGGVVNHVTAARAPDGRLVAYTDIFTCVERHAFAHQGDTLVDPSHRGRRLGLRIKLANLEVLAGEHPEVRAIDTFNADDNRWMIAVNEAMGFVPIQHITDWELNLAEFESAGSDRGRGQAGTTAAISVAASGP